MNKTLRQGDIIANRYRLEKFLGAGGFAVVWKAHDTLTDAVVAIKIFSSLDNDSIRNLTAEYLQVSGLSHPGILRAEHFDCEDNTPFIVMRFANGGSLASKIGSMGRQEVYRMLINIASALMYIHRNGLVHQDIKPANIFVDRDANNVIHYLLGDFGISSRIRSTLNKSNQTGNSGNLLTSAYAPPEKFSSHREERLPNPKGDIFSLGITAYELITGHLPFDDLDTGRELFYHPETRIELEEIADINLRYIIGECLLPNPTQRPDASELLQMLKGGMAPRTDYGRKKEPSAVKQQQPFYSKVERVSDYEYTHVSPQLKKEKGKSIKRETKGSGKLHIFLILFLCVAVSVTGIIVFVNFNDLVNSHGINHSLYNSVSRQATEENEIKSIKENGTKDSEKRTEKDNKENTLLQSEVSDSISVPNAPNYHGRSTFEESEVVDSLAK